MSDADDKLAKATDDAAIIDECVKRLQWAVTAESENRANAVDDKAFLRGDQWEPGIKAQRTRDQRPCLTVNKLPTFLHQVTNSQRQNVPSIKVHPVADGDAKVAEVVQGGIRHVEYSSGADVAYDTAVNDAAAIGFGYFRLVTDYCREDSFDQEIQFRRIRNPFTVYLGPHVNPDGSDMQWAVLSDRMSRVDFRAQYPSSDPCDFSAVRGLGDAWTSWASEADLRLAEYYRITKKPAKVVLLTNGESGYKDDLLEMPPGVTIAQEREGTKSVVEWFKLTATQIVDRAEIPCRWIPVFPVYGDEIDIDGKVYRSGLIRNAKDPARMYNFWMTAATEEVALRPKSKYIGAEGQFEGHEAEWMAANTSSAPFLQYKPKAIGGLLAPPPQRQPMADLPVGVLSMAAHASDDVKATTGIFDASLGARSNETSGRAINARDRQGETANYHYTDNLNITLRHCGRCIVDMWPRVYDGQRTLQIMGVDGKVSAVDINKPVRENVKQPDGTLQAVDRVMNDMTVGEYAVTISSGPSYDTLRQEAVDGMIAAGQSWPKLWEVAGDKLVRSMDWPMADEIADRLEKTVPQELRDGEDDEGPPPIPPEIQQKLQQYESALHDAMQQLDEAQNGIRQVQIKAEADVQKAQMQANAQLAVAQINAASREEVEEIKGMVAMLLQHMQPPPQLDGVAGGAIESKAQPSGEVTS